MKRAEGVHEGELVERLGPFTFIQGEKGLRITQDPFLLADFLLPLDDSDKVMDLGAGTGVIPVVLAWKTPAKEITGVEADRRAASLARRNVSINGLGYRVRIIEGDLRGLPGAYERGHFTVVVSNPPYVKAGAGRVSPLGGRGAARSETMGTIEDFLKVTDYLLAKEDEGKACYIFPVTRLPEMLEGLGRNHLVPTRLQFIHTGKDKDASLFLIEARRTGTLKVLPPVFL